jgi:sporulation protein YlmC with PRC-barrel domain
MSVSRLDRTSTATLASKVIDTPVFSATGEKIGFVQDLVLDKQSDRILYAAIGVGGVFGFGRRFLPIPWSLLDYRHERGGYVSSVAGDALRRSPVYPLEIIVKEVGFFCDQLEIPLAVRESE